MFKKILPIVLLLTISNIQALDWFDKQFNKGFQRPRPKSCVSTTETNFEYGPNKESSLKKELGTSALITGTCFVFAVGVLKGANFLRKLTT